MATTAWASASTFRDTDMRGGANGARIRLAPQKDWAANSPKALAKVLKRLERVQQEFNKAQSGDKQVSLADLIVLGGAAAIEAAAQASGQDVQVPFKPGRTDASQAQTDVNSFAVLEPKADGFRNYYAAGNYRSPAEPLVDKVDMPTLTATPMTVLVGGLRPLHVTGEDAEHGMSTERPSTLSNVFFVYLLCLATLWSTSPSPWGG